MGSDVRVEGGPLPPHSIVQATPDWGDPFRRFLTTAKRFAYFRPDLGIPFTMLSPAAIDSDELLAFLDGGDEPAALSRGWVAATTRRRQVLGAVAARLDERTSRCYLHSFYVAPELKGRGLGKELFERVVQFADGCPIHLDVVEYLVDTIAVYRRWGFRVDDGTGEVVYAWRGWPDAYRNFKGVAMVKAGKATR
jgi:GNAT superfamily N-acetyltransferase